jgi:hypothetical protein
MKRFCLGFIFISFPVFAQTVDVKDVNAGNENTTIEIRKGAPGQPERRDALWEIQDGTADIEGDASATAREAKANWKKSCDEWKKEFREDNKENKVLSVSCGKPTCGGEVGQKTCTSQASYKIKTKIN